MTTYKDLLQQRDLLEKQIEEAKEREFVAVIAEIKQKMLDYGISIADLGLARVGKTGKGRPRAGVAPKYRDTVTGSTWSGRGKPPKWIAGKNREEFLIHK
jgi:DNA-binding protein H-NS